MLLALDAGNSNITIGAFDGRKLVCQWRLRTVHEQTADEWGILLHNLFSPAGLDIASVDGMIISSVVPPIDSTLAFMAQRYFHTEPMFVGARTDLGPHDPVRQSVRSRRRPAGERRRRLLQIRRPVRGGGPGHHHQLRRDLEGRRVSRRRHRGRHRHLDRRAVQQDGAPAAGRFPAAQGRRRHQHRRAACGRACTTARSG